MAQIIKKEFVLEGLDCASCSMKIEERVGRLDHVTFSSINFATKTLMIEVLETSDIEQITAEATKIVALLEPGVVVSEKRRIISRIESGVQVIDTQAKEKSLHKEVISEEKLFSTSEFLRLGAGTLLFGVGLLFQFTQPIEFGIFFVSYLLVGGDVLLNALKNIARGQVFDENFLMGIATIGAFAIGEYPEGVAVMLFYQIGEFFQSKAVDHSRKSIGALMAIRPDFANLKIGDGVERVAPESVEIGSIIIVKPGEKVPLDGKILTGVSTLDTAAITGESIPRTVTAGDLILSGTINQGGLLTVEVTKVFGDSTVSKILELVENASSRKSPTEKFITKFARYYTPAVVGIAAALAFVPPLVLPNAVLSDWIYRALVFLVVSCPCALVISIPLGFFGGIGGASKSGILMKGSNYLEALNQVETVVFDKTGTLTQGVFQVTQVVPLLEGMTSEKLLECAAMAESYSSHPIGRSIVSAYGNALDISLVEDYDEQFGYGVKATVKGQKVVAGNSKFLMKEGITLDSLQIPENIATVVHIAIDDRYSGYIAIADVLKQDAHLAVASLRKLGVKRIVMLTGDNKAVGEQIGLELGLDEVYAELLPHQKVEKLEILESRISKKGKLVFVGDGINDAPVLMRADIGIAMGGLGSDAAIEAADVVIMTDEPSKIATAINIAQRTKKIVWQNIVFAFGVKAIVLILGAGGLATMWEAVFADVGVAILAVLNATRVLHGKHIKYDTESHTEIH
jgi:Cd2+/Zn2+-exporting ATPase